MALAVLLPLSISTSQVYGASYNMTYGLGYTGVPFAGGVIIMTSNLTNTGQLTVRITGISFSTDFSSNGTFVDRSSSYPFNITTGTSKQVNTPVTIPMDAATGNHVVTATASWRYANATGWFNAPSVSVSKTVMVSQTIDSFFAGMLTLLLIALGVVAVIVVLVVFLVVRRGRKKAGTPASPQTGQAPAPSH